MIKRWPIFLLDENTSPPAGGGSDSAGGAPAQPSAPSPGGAEGGPPQSAGDAPSHHDPLDGMESNDYYDSIDLGDQSAGTGDEPGAGTAPPVAGAQGEPPVAAPVTPAPQVQPQQPVAPPTAPAAQGGDVQQGPQSQLDQALEGLKGAANQTALADWAAQNLFKLSPEDLQAYDTDPNTFIPKLMGRVYTNAMQSAVNLIKNLVPEMVNSGMVAQQSRAARASEALNEFYQSNPHLSADQHGAAVDKWARSFRAMNPGASRQEAIAFVGKAVSAEFGIWPQSNGSGQPAARRAAPFAPARPGGRAPAAAKGPHDPYAGMEDELDQ